MIQPVHDDAYRSAMNAATEQLSRINREFLGLSNRIHQLDAAVEALKPLLDERTEVRRPLDEWTEAAQMEETAVAPRRRNDSILGLAVA